MILSIFVVEISQAKQRTLVIDVRVVHGKLLSFQFFIGVFVFLVLVFEFLAVEKFLIALSEVSLLNLYLPLQVSVLLRLKPQFFIQVFPRLSLVSSVP